MRKLGITLFLLLAGIGAANAETGLKQGEYACYGDGGEVLIGLGFKVLPGGNYTDLDNQSKGTYAIDADNVVFHGGHLDGQTGRELKDGRFRIGMMADCEPYQ